jgi:hypothetical protein
VAVQVDKHGGRRKKKREKRKKKREKGKKKREKRKKKREKRIREEERPASLRLLVSLPNHTPYSLLPTPYSLLLITLFHQE